MISDILIFKTDSTDPYYNIATEKYLFDTLYDGSLILYLWQNENTVVIGRNQNPWAECNCSLLESEGGHLARRLSGGGAVYHDVGNLNFTFICHDADYDLSKHLEVIKEAAKTAGIETEISGRNDILADGRKFSGNAFYNSDKKSCHHGTLLLRTNTEKMSRYLTPSREKLRAKGVKSVSSRVINLCELAPELSPDTMAENMIAAVGKVFSAQVRPYPEPDTAKIEELAAGFRDWNFRYGKTVAFSVAAPGSFPWGQTELCLNVENGIISEAVMYTDSMDATLSDTVSAALKGIRLSSQDIEAALSNVLPYDIAQDIFSTLKERVL